MDKLIKQSIDARREAIGASYKIDAGAQKKIDALFGEIEKLGEKCGDVGEFEAEFSKSPLNQKYLDLFTEIATKCAPKTAVPKASMGGVGEMVAKDAAAGALESAADQALREVVPTRAAVHQKVHDEVQSIPVVGDAVDAVQKASYLGHLGKLFGKKKDK